MNKKQVQREIKVTEESAQENDMVVCVGSASRNCELHKLCMKPREVQ